MRGSDGMQEGLFTVAKLEDFVPADHPLRPIRLLVNEALERLNGLFNLIYADSGRACIAPEKLLRAMLIQVFFSVRSERQLVQQVRFNLLYRWFIGLAIDDDVWDHSSFSKNRDRLLEHAVVESFFTEEMTLADKQALLSKDHFSVDGPLIQAWASHKSFVRKDGMALQCHVLMQNRSGLVVGAVVTHADGMGKRAAALAMLDTLPGKHAKTIAADKAYDTRDFIDACRQRRVTPHVAANDTRIGGSAIDGRTTRHGGYAVSQTIRKSIEEHFGWGKTIGRIRQTVYRGLRRADQHFKLTMTASNIVRMARMFSVTARGAAQRRGKNAAAAARSRSRSAIAAAPSLASVTRSTKISSHRMHLSIR
jgi:transposase